MKEEYKNMTNQELYQSKLCGVDECIAQIRDGDIVTVGADCNEPEAILTRLHLAADRLHNVTLVKGRTGSYECIHKPGMAGHIDSRNFFFSADLREGFRQGNTSFVPADLPDFGPFSNGFLPTNVYIVSTTPMDEDGNFGVGLSLMYDKETLETCLAQPNGRVILEVNPNLHPVRGELKINIKDVACLTEAPRALPAVPYAPSTEVEDKIGAYVAELVNDGDTIQLGIGSLPDAVARALMSKKELGLHTEMFTSSMGEMIRKGIITGERKNLNPGLHVGTFAGGDQALYDTLSQNPNCRIAPGSYAVNPMIIMQNDNMVSINTILEMDLTGQVCSESMGTTQFSGSGGGFCFAYGALHSKGGRGILTFASRSKKGQPKIKTVLTPGAAVTIPRNYVDYIVTEYGVAALRGRSVRERAKALIAIAHPDDRAELTRQARELLYI